ncbi:LOW QUALITY PROTEIN: centriolar coiled-coil protein of 110 kDa-like [Pristis pectinata]|uniref:LOW QUALITY PROTEIN: centriolar coiled-coil protein of 110 kDa-like n=1 Tax=Pristis pectinata TaxID=685728 RepID=UPI00223CFE49|nr:LOW QUALITY PROTEIN: centriolar coiled-coil protein of 110 kDa-like [Pristis pectinata]
MEDYEEFCKRHLARIQSEMVKNEISRSVYQKNTSVIRFHGIAVLSPLMNTERKLEMQQYRQKAMELELGRYKARKSALLTRVEEIIENVQVCKVPSTAECARDLITEPPANDFTTIPHTNKSSVSPMFTEKSEDLILSSKPLLKLKENISNGNSDERCTEISDLPKSTCSIQTNDASSIFVSPIKESKTDVLPPAKESPDHYAMSLQNLLKKSREYIEKEQNRRSGKNVFKEGTNESHSDKENEGVKVDDWENGRNKISNKSQSPSPVIVDKSSSARSSLQSQVASVTNESFELHDKTALGMSASDLCTNLDFAAKSMKGSSKEFESDEEWINSSAYEYESSLLKSLTGSYAKLPNPEPSRSPKIHQRRPRTSANIVINNPVNAYELSPKEKFSGLPGTNQGQINIGSLDVRRAIPNELPTVVNQEEIERSAGKLQDLSMSLGKINDTVTKNNSQYTCSEFSVKSEINKIGTVVDNEVHLPIRSLIHKDSYDLERTSSLLASKLEISQLSATQNELDLNGQKTTSLIEKAKQGSPVVLNKSYDVKHPSPVLLQAQSTRQQTDFLVASSESEKSPQSNVDIKAKRKLDLGTLNAKESKQFAVKTTTSFVQEMNRLIQERHQRVPVIRNESEVPLNIHIKQVDEELITKQMMAFVEMRKQLEEQHTLQLSMLIAEQEKEQEKLRREIEEQERRLREQTNFLRESSESCSSKGTSLDWKRINGNYLVSSLINRVDGSHSVLTSNSISPDSSFNRWGVRDDEVQSSSFVGRLRSRWSQMNTPESQHKFNKITALAKGFLTRRLMKTVKLKQLQQTVKDTMEFINNLQTETPLKRGAVSSQDISLQERVVAQLRAALYEIHDIFFVLNPNERMQILSQDREIRKEKQLRQMEKWKSPKERIALSVATQKSLDRKRQIKAAEVGITSKQKSQAKQKASCETRILQPSQGQNAPAQRLLHRQGVHTSKKGVEKNRERDSESRFPRKTVPGVCPGRALKTKSSITTR